MKYSKSKLFWKIENCRKNIILIDWQEGSQEYYAFVKEHIESGCHQVAVTSEMMLEFIGMIAINDKINIDKIEMMEVDEETDSELAILVERSHSNRGMILRLIDKLRYLAEKSSIEIKRIYLSERQNNITNSIFVQVNGVVGISSKESILVDTLINCIKGFFDE